MQKTLARSNSAEPASAGPQRLRLASEAGLSLVEMLVALVMVTIVSLGASQLVLSSAEIVRDAGYTTTASMLAMEKIEELQQLDYDDDLLAAGEYSDDEIPSFEDYTRQWTIEDDTPSAGLKRITVVVTSRWTNNSAPARTSRAITYRASAEYAAGIKP